MTEFFNEVLGHVMEDVINGIQHGCFFFFVPIAAIFINGEMMIVRYIQNHMQFERIRTGQFAFPANPNVSEDARQLIRGLLKINPRKRLGSRGAYQVMEAAFFKGIDWQRLLRKELTPPFKARADEPANGRAADSPPPESKRVDIANFTYDELNAES